MRTDDPIELVVVQHGRTFQVPRSVAQGGEDAVQDFIAAETANLRAAGAPPAPPTAPSPPPPPAPSEEA